eukprot:CAMPEP_0180496854 /NCGR_PEP_ID=MMETSP1036_2-20121128/42495_1 /TAXON_ID=632150 /ORGANISM="Azadinium spinosum, Strain 3D9" /LENGTH=168 /DNA_ID=CAMNT_0022505391 /DNA_START=105 /DNA_END=608 /DNA_ORIENTATION=+
MAYSGSVKSFNPNKGYGFVICEGAEIFIHINDCKGGMPQQGDMISFDVVDSDTKPGTKKATNINGGSAPAKGVLGTGAHQGTVKSFAQSTGYGFINYQGGEIFVHLADCKGGRPQAGDTVAFDIEQSKTKPGQTTAVNVTGGTAPLFYEDYSGGKGKGKDGGKDGGKG